MHSSTRAPTHARTHAQGHTPVMQMVPKTCDPLVRFCIAPETLLMPALPAEMLRKCAYSTEYAKPNLADLVGPVCLALGLSPYEVQRWCGDDAVVCAAAAWVERVILPCHLVFSGWFK